MRPEPAELAETAPHPMPVRGMPTTTRGDDVSDIETVRRAVFAEVAHAMNCIADIWERDGSDPCRVRISREYANAYRAYAEGYGAPTGSAKFRAAMDSAYREPE